MWYNRVIWFFFLSLDSRKLNGISDGFVYLCEREYYSRIMYLKMWNVIW